MITRGQNKSRARQDTSEIHRRFLQTLDTDRQRTRHSPVETTRSRNGVRWDRVYSTQLYFSQTPTVQHGSALGFPRKELEISFKLFFRYVVDSFNHRVFRTYSTGIPRVPRWSCGQVVSLSLPSVPDIRLAVLSSSLKHGRRKKKKGQVPKRLWPGICIARYTLLSTAKVADYVMTRPKKGATTTGRDGCTLINLMDSNCETSHEFGPSVPPSLFRERRQARLDCLGPSTAWAPGFRKRAPTLRGSVDEADSTGWSHFKHHQEPPKKMPSPSYPSRRRCCKRLLQASQKNKLEFSMSDSFDISMSSPPCGCRGPPGCTRGRHFFHFL